MFLDSHLSGNGNTAPSAWKRKHSCLRWLHTDHSPISRLLQPFVVNGLHQVAWRHLVVMRSIEDMYIIVQFLLNFLFSIVLVWLQWPIVRFCRLVLVLWYFTIDRLEMNGDQWMDGIRRVQGIDSIVVGGCGGWLWILGEDQLSEDKGAQFGEGSRAPAAVRLAVFYCV